MGPGAAQVQQRMSAIELLDSWYMPPPGQLPEGLMEMEFRHRYRNLDDERYAHVKREIDGRVAELPIYN